MFVHSPRATRVRAQSPLQVCRSGVFEAPVQQHHVAHVHGEQERRVCVVGVRGREWNGPECRLARGFGRDDATEVNAPSDEQQLITDGGKSAELSVTRNHVHGRSEVTGERLQQQRNGTVLETEGRRGWSVCTVCCSSLCVGQRPLSPCRKPWAANFTHCGCGSCGEASHQDVQRSWAPATVICTCHTSFTAA